MTVTGSIATQAERTSAVDHTLHHPDVQAAASQWSEAQTLHVACAYNNPYRWESRRRLMNDFRRNLASQPNIVLHVIELAYGDRPWEVTDSSHPLDYQLRSSAELWHKENLLNLAIARFPAGWQYGAYLDGDFLMTRRDWALEAVHLLQHYAWVQLFSTYTDLSRDHRPLGVIPSFVSHFQKSAQIAGYYTGGSPGGAWAFRRSAFEACGGLLDTCILGSGDWYMAAGLVGVKDRRPETVNATAEYLKSIQVWQQRALALKGNVGVINNHALHFWHGDKTMRAYGTRWQILRDNDFDPYTDLLRDSQGVYSLTPDKPKLRDAIRRYFLSRQEDA